MYSMYEEIYFKESTHVIVAAEKSETPRTAGQAGVDRSLSLESIGQVGMLET